MRRNGTYMLAVALGSLLASDASAQPPWVRPFPQTAPQTTFPGGFGTPLFQNGNVSQNLSLTRQQQAQLQEANYRLQAEFYRESAQLGPIRDPQRNLRRQELIQAYEAESLRSAGTIMTPEQFDRYQQWGLANRGFDGEMLRRLNATEAQLQRMQSLGWPAGAPGEPLYPNGGYWWHYQLRNGTLNPALWSQQWGR